MAKVKNKVTGVVAEVPDEDAQRLGPEWQPVNAPKPRSRSRKASAEEE